VEVAMIEPTGVPAAFEQLVRADAVSDVLRFAISEWRRNTCYKPG